MADLRDEDLVEALNSLRVQPTGPAIAQQKHVLDALRTYLQEVEGTAATVNELDQKTRHRIMVPFGPLAFFPGDIVHTNEYLVHLGTCHLMKHESYGVVRSTELSNSNSQLFRPFHPFVILGDSTYAEMSKAQTLGFLERREASLRGQLAAGEEDLQRLTARLARAEASDAEFGASFPLLRDLIYDTLRVLSSFTALNLDLQPTPDTLITSCLHCV